MLQGIQKYGPYIVDWRAASMAFTPKVPFRAFSTALTAQTSDYETMQ